MSDAKRVRRAFKKIADGLFVNHDAGITIIHRPFTDADRPWTVAYKMASLTDTWTRDERFTTRKEADAFARSLMDRMDRQRGAR